MRLVLMAAGQQLVSLTKRSFTDAALRPQSWPQRKKPPESKISPSGKVTVTGNHALLQKSTMLRKSIRITGLTGNTVSVGSDRPYAAVHQLGDHAVSANSLNAPRSFRFLPARSSRIPCLRCR